LGIVVLVFLVPLRGLLRTQGPPMEEGFMLVFPERVLEGDLPNRDFLHLYGPGSLWALAASFKAFGVSLVTERLFGLAQQLAIVFGVYWLARLWGRRLAVCCALISAIIIIPPIGLTALAWVGAVGLGVLGLAAGLRSRGNQDERAARRWAFGAGLVLGCALLFRLDLAVAIGLALLALLRGMPKARVRALLVGLAAGVAPYLIHLVTAGPVNVVQGMILDPVVYLRGGRRLPIPPSWSQLDGFLQRAGDLEQISWPIPALTTAQQLFVWFFLLLGSVAFLVAVGWWRIRQEPTSMTARTLLVVALFSVGLVPQGVQRVDSTHFAWVACVSMAFVPVAVVELVRHRVPRLAPKRLALFAGAAGIGVLLFVIPTFTVRRYTDYSLQSIDIHRTAYPIENDGRSFYYGKQDRADAANQVIAEAERISEPGDRLFVGPVNLRKTPYSDAYLYYMLPELTPATYYIEMDPGVANASDSGLDDDLASADIAILSSIWDDWDEPNDSRQEGSAAPERVLKDQFCLVGGYEDRYELYQKCR
jgi:hypothetical protein